MNEPNSSSNLIAAASESQSATDSQLLMRFTKQGDQIAFEILLQRHGKMVFGICRRILRRHHEAEDAFQATFLSLAQSATQISRPELLACWLHRVARHAALKVRAAGLKRQQIEQSGELEMDVTCESTSDASVLWSEVSPVLDEELERLSDPLRCVVILCDVEGKTRKDVARQLNWPEATVSSRLMKARSLLAERLTRRGVALSAVTLTALLTQNAASAAVPTTLIAATLALTAGSGLVQTTTSVGAFSKFTSIFWPISQSMMAGGLALTLVASTLIVAAGIGVKPKTAPMQLGVALADPLKPPFDEIAATYRQNYAAIESLRIEYQIRSEALMNPEILWKGWKRFPIPEEERTANLVIDHEKTYFRERSRAKSINSIIDEIKKRRPQRPARGDEPTADTLSYQEILEWSPHAQVETRERIYAFDGLVLRHNNHGHELKDDQHISRPNFVFTNASQADRQMFNDRNYLDLIQVGITGATLPHDFTFRQRHRLPDLLSQGIWNVVSEHESLRGSDCMVIESSETDKLWLDRNAGFALRRHTKQRPFRIDNEYLDLRPVAGQFWIPQTIVETRYAENLVPQEYLGKPAVRTKYELTLVELNQPVSQDQFKLVPSEHAMVFDQTLNPLNTYGWPIEINTGSNESSTVNYVQPADGATVPDVARSAQIELGKQIQSSQGSWPSLRMSSASISIRWFLALNLVVLSIAAVIIFYRRRSM